jgi:FkbM family methyltransferase
MPASSLHSCVAGDYERANQELFVAHLRPGDVVYDVGANVGFFTMLAARLVGPAGSVVAFEPFPPALTALRRHVALNGLQNVRVEPAAVSRQAGVGAFSGHEQITMGHLADQGELKVELTTLDEAVRKAGRAPDLLKIDVEGAERDVLEGGRSMLEGHGPVVVLSTHGSESHAVCCALLEGLGYEVAESPSEIRTAEFDFLGDVVGVRRPA